MDNRDNSFLSYLIEKIENNKDIIGTVISSSVFIQLLFLFICNEEFRMIFTKSYLFFFIFLLLLFLTVSCGVFLYLFNDKLNDSYDEMSKINCLKCPKKNIEIISQQKYKKNLQIFSLKELEKLEQNLKCDDHVWVIMSDIKSETNARITSKITENNLKKGVTYNFFIPDILKNSATILELERKSSSYSNIAIIKIDPKYKLLFEKIDVVIYAPDKNRAEGRAGFICVNFSNNNDLMFFKRLSESDLKNLIGQLKLISEELNAK